jgi:hypothetical protein
VTITTMRAARVKAVSDEYRDQAHDGAREALAVDGSSRYVMVERNLRYGRGYWLSQFDSPDEAGAYHLGQEYREDWDLIKLVDLDTGKEWEPEFRVIWSRMP